MIGPLGPPPQRFFETHSPYFPYYLTRRKPEQLMSKTIADVMQMVEDYEVKFVDLRLPIPGAKSRTRHGARIAF